MNAASKNALLVGVAAIAIAGWVFAFLGGFPNLQPRGGEQQIKDERLTFGAFPAQQHGSSEQDMEEERLRMEMEQQRLRKTVYYGYWNVGSNIPCISAKAGETPSIEIYAENIYAPDAVIDFTLTAKRNADVSLEASDGFQQSATKRLTVLEGTETLRQSFYVKPHENADQIQLTLDAKAIDPPDIILQYTLEFSNTVVFSNNGSGNYCRE